MDFPLFLIVKKGDHILNKYIYTGEIDQDKLSEWANNWNSTAISTREKTEQSDVLSPSPLLVHNHLHPYI